MLVREEEVPEPFGAGAVAKLDKDLWVRNTGRDLAVERLERLALNWIDMLLHELAQTPEKRGHSV
jgi:hypothetical protein